MTPIEALVVLSLQWVPCPASETPDQCAAHRTDIALDAMTIAETDPLPTRGLSLTQRAERTAVMILATASLESRFDEEAVSRTGDRCVMQVHPIGSESVAARGDCMRIALSRMHWSWVTCGATGHRDWLSPFKTGRCYNEQRDARINLARAVNGWATYRKLTEAKP
jgi:hypothetical protein